MASQCEPEWSSSGLGTRLLRCVRSRSFANMRSQSWSLLTGPFLREPVRMIAAVAPNAAIDERDQAFDARGIRCERHLCASKRCGECGSRHSREPLRASLQRRRYFLVERGTAQYVPQHNQGRARRQFFPRTYRYLQPGNEKICFRKLLRACGRQIAGQPSSVWQAVRKNLEAI